MNDWQSFESAYPLLGQSLRFARLNNRLAHSYLVVSSNASLRNSFPLLLASLVACRQPGPDGSPCGECPICRELADGLYPDLFQLAPTSKSREIKIGADDDDPDSLRNFEAKFYLTSTTPNGWKIGIIYDCDTMNANAQNAFLKTLEEPPKNCLFILVTGRPSALLPTIRSRCQILTLTDNHCKYNLDDFSGLMEILMTLTFHAHGSLPEAEKCAASLIEMMNALYDKAEASVNEKWKSRLAESDNLESSAKKLIETRMEGETGCEYRRLREEFLSIIHTWFAQLVLLASAQDAVLPNPEIMSLWLEASPRPSIAPREAVRMLSEAEYLLRVLNTNVNDELAVRSFALSVAINVRAGV